MVEGADPGCAEASARHLAIKAAEASKSRGILSPDPEHLVPSDDHRLGADAARDDRPILHGLDANGLPRSASDRGLVLVDYSILSVRAPRAVSQNLDPGNLDDSRAEGR